MPKTRKGSKTPGHGPERHGLLTTGDVARVCGVTRDGVGHWIRAGKLPAFRTPGGHFRIQADDLHAFLRRSGSGGPVAATDTAALRILVVDDEPSIRALLSELLSDAGFQVVTASCFDEALAATRVQPPHLVITDVALPGSDGTELARTLRSQPAMAGVPIIAVTGVFDSRVTQRVYGAGIDLLLAKPFRPDQVVGEVRRLLSVASAHETGEVRP
jgi:excisionase family DNA binding protein